MKTPQLQRRIDKATSLTTQSFKSMPQSTLAGLAMDLVQLVADMSDAMDTPSTTAKPPRRVINTQTMTPLFLDGSSIHAAS